MANPLNNYRIFIADSDVEMTRVLKKMLEGMGFSHIHTSTRAKDVLSALQKDPIDFLITDWTLDQIDGQQLIKTIRQDPRSPNPTLPIVMLTGRAELSDVLAARDLGVNEYVVKPFSAKSIYTRLERLVENPRDFIVTETFVGPERRAQKAPPPGISERRQLQLTPQKKLVTGSSVNDTKTPKIWAADLSLKRKLGVDTHLSSLITPGVLNQAQMAIASIATESMQWIKDSMNELVIAHSALLKGQGFAKAHAAKMSQAALRISSRAGTFGYQETAQVAYMLHLFCGVRFDPQKSIHLVIAEKHIEVLQVTLSNSIRSSHVANDNQIIVELQHLIDKYGY